MNTPKTTRQPRQAAARRHEEYDEFRESLAAPIPNNSYRSDVDLIDDEPPAAEQIIRWIAGILILLLAVRFLIDYLSPDRFGAWASFFYVSTNWAVQPFQSLYGQSFVIGPTGFLDWAALTAIAAISAVAWIIVRLLRPKS
ncbi:MAG TPA: hypothetical protein VMS08_03560 [Candidatus Saccharimonadia bacterium]|nr:hypothetical protein [Candidatus Saccharimonadia bacterium]